jgi:hypothetical protein
MQIAGVLHGDVAAKSDLRCRPAAAQRNIKKGSNFEVFSAEHPFFGTMKVTSKIDAHKRRFSCITSSKRNFVTQISSHAVSDLDVGHTIMKAVMDKMVAEPNITEKEDIYSLRDAACKDILDTAKGPDKDKAKGKDNDTGKNKGNTDKGGDKEKHTQSKGKDKDKDKHKDKDKGKTAKHTKAEKPKKAKASAKKKGKAEKSKAEKKGKGKKKEKSESSKAQKKKAETDDGNGSEVGDCAPCADEEETTPLKATAKAAESISESDTDSSESVSS